MASCIRCGTANYKESGIYYLIGDAIPIQLIIVPRLSKHNNYWLNNLRNDLKAGAEIRTFIEQYGENKNSKLYQTLADTIMRAMLMHSKEANNRKQEIDRQHHTIPNQRANDKHHGNVYNLLFRYGKVRSQNMEKLKSSFPTFCKRTFPQLHKIASYAHYAQCRLLRKPSHFIIYSRK